MTEDTVLTRESGTNEPIRELIKYEFIVEEFFR